MPLQSKFQWLVSMNWNRNAGVYSGFRIDMMTPIYSFQFPPFVFNKPTEPFATDRFQTAISIILSFSDKKTSWTSTDKQPSTAS